MVKPKKGSKVVPKDKAPLRELPLPYEVLAGKFQLSPADVGASGPGSSFRITHTRSRGR